MASERRETVTDDVRGVLRGIDGGPPTMAEILQRGWPLGWGRRASARSRRRWPTWKSATRSLWIDRRDRTGTGGAPTSRRSSSARRGCIESDEEKVVSA